MTSYSFCYTSMGEEGITKNDDEMKKATSFPGGFAFTQIHFLIT